MVELLSSWQSIAATAIIISIILSGIALGFGRAFSTKRLERFGADEMLQSIINAAILGFAISLSAVVVQISSELSPQMQNITCISNSTPTEYVLCAINSTTTSSFELSQSLVRILNTLSYYQTLNLHFGNFSIQPLVNLNSISNQFSNILYSLQISTFAASINTHILSFISSNWFGALFAAGLVLRSFFLSRKFGAFLIAASLSLIIFYPLAIMMFQIPLLELADAQSAATSFLSNPTYQTIPIIDLNNNNAIADKIYNMSFLGTAIQSGSTGQNGTNRTNSTVIQADFTGDLTLLVQKTTNAASALFFYSIIVPFFAMIATLVLIKELSHSFAGEIATEISQI